MANTSFPTESKGVLRSKDSLFTASSIDVARNLENSHSMISSKFTGSSQIASRLDTDTNSIEWITFGARPGSFIWSIENAKGVTVYCVYYEYPPTRYL
jgi:hypothetical protein